MALDLLTGWALFAGLLLSVGSVAARWAVLPRAWADAPDRLSSELRRCAGVGVWGAGLTTVGVALYLVRQMAEFRDPFVPWTDDAALLLSTSWGTSWKGAAAATVILLGALLLARRGQKAAWWLATPLALALAALPGLTGHASGVEEGRIVALVADWSHVVAASAWMGGLAVVLVAGRPGVEPAPGGGPPVLSRLVHAFSPLAMISVGVLILSGTYAAWIHLPEPEALLSTSYGRILLVKVLLALVVMGLGARNVRILTPRLNAPGGPRALRRSAALELAAAQLVLLATALLVRTSPMGS